MPPKIRELAKKLMTQPEQITMALSKPAEGVLQGAYVLYERQKVDLIKKLIADKPNYESIIIFSSTKRKVNDIVRALREHSGVVKGISSDFDQAERERVLADFRSKKTRVIVATDVLSRGIDIKGINLVINFDVPGNAEDYVHRVGRTARADETGVALTLINEDDMNNFYHIEQLIGSEVLKIPLPKEFGPGPEWNPKRRGRKSSRARGGRKRGHRHSRTRRR